jgi:hypothetical protein
VTRKLDKSQWRTVFDWLARHFRKRPPRRKAPCGGRLSRRVVRRLASSGDHAAERQPAYAAVGRAFLSCFRVLRADPAAHRGGAVSRTRATRRSVRDNGVRGDLRRSRARRARTSDGVARRFPARAELNLLRPSASRGPWSFATPLACRHIATRIVTMAAPAQLARGGVPLLGASGLDSP